MRSVYALRGPFVSITRSTAAGCAEYGHTGLLSNLQQHASNTAQRLWHCVHTSPWLVTSSCVSYSSSSSSSNNNNSSSSSSSVENKFNNYSQVEAVQLKPSNTGPLKTAAADGYALSSILQELKVSYRASTQVVEYNRKQPLRADVLVSNIKQLQECFGAALVNKMLEQAPGMAVRSADTLQQHYEGLKGVLGGNDLALSIVTKAPDLLNHAPESIRTRLAALQDLFEVGQRKTLELVRKAPTLLRSQPSRVAGLVGYLQQVSGMSAQQVLHVLLMWPVLATSSLQLVQQRFQVVQQLLKASPAEMRYICRASATLLVRDPGYLANNIAEIAQMLQLTEDAVLPILRKQPNLLHWNASELRTRMTVLCQSLQLPPESLVSLLVHNNVLITHYKDIPERVNYLKNYLGLAESELLLLLQDKLSLLRLPTDLMDSKLACANSLALLNPTWMADLQAMPPQLKLGILQLGQARFFRLAYLVHTGQQDCGTFGQYLRASHPTFDRLFPDFAEWLDRYNQIVAHQDIPIVPSFTPKGPGNPASYPVVPPRSSLAAGRSRTRAAAADADDEEGPGQPDAVDGTVPASPCRAGSTNSGTNSSISGGSIPSAQDAGSSTAIGHPPTPSAVLATWWGIEESRVQELLQVLTGPKKRFSWQQWQQRLGALQSLMAELGWVTAHSATHATADVHPPDEAQSPAADSSGVGPSAGSSRGHASSGTSGGSRSAASIACSSGSGADPAHELPQSCQADSSRAALAQVVAASAASHQDHPEQPRQQRRKRSNRMQSQEKAAMAAALEKLSPATQEALQCAVDSGHAAAVACVSVACHLAPFSSQLYPLPPVPPPLVVQFALEHPQVVSRMAFVANCSMLAALVAESQYLRSWLQQGDLMLLSKSLDKDPARFKMVQYLAQTQQPTPWSFTCEQLLAHIVLGPQGKGKARGRAAFVAAYPGYAAWEQAMHSL